MNADEKKQLLEKVKGYFDGDEKISTTGDWRYEFTEDEDGDYCFKGGMAIDSKFKSVSFILYVLERGLLLQTACPLGVEKEQRDKMYDFLSFVNMRQISGFFLMDPRDGELIHKSFFDGDAALKMEGTDFGDMVMDRLMLGAAQAWKRFGNKGFASIMFDLVDKDESMEVLCDKCISE